MLPPHWRHAGLRVGHRAGCTCGLAVRDHPCLLPYLLPLLGKEVEELLYKLVAVLAGLIRERQNLIHCTLCTLHDLLPAAVHRLLFEQGEDAVLAGVLHALDHLEGQEAADEVKDRLRYRDCIEIATLAVNATNKTRDPAPVEAAIRGLMSGPAITMSRPEIEARLAELEDESDELGRLCKTLS